MPEVMTVNELVSNAQDIKKHLLDSLGVNGVEIFGSIIVTKAIQFSSNKVFSSVTKNESGFGIRYQKDGLTYFQAIDGLSLDKIKHDLRNNQGEQALAYSQKVFDFAPRKNGVVEKDQYNTQIAELTLQDLFDYVQSIADAAADHKSPFFINTGILMTREVQQIIVNTNDLELMNKGTFIQLIEHLIAGSKNEITFESNVSIGSRSLNNFDPQKITISELDKFKKYTKVSKLKGNRIVSVIFTSKAMNQISDNLLRHLLSAKYLSSNQVQVKLPKLSEKITLVEESGLKTRLSGHAFDHEGVPTKNLTLYRDGMPKSNPVDLLTASETNGTPTGSTYRGIPLFSDSTLHRNPPLITFTNIKINPGDSDEDQLLEGIEKGLEINGVGKVNYFDLNTGNFEITSTEAIHINKGKRGKAAGRITVYGNLFEVLSFVEEVGKDVEQGFYSEIPSLKINRIRVQGKPKQGH